MRYLTAGESHGPALVGILEGLPAGPGGGPAGWSWCSSRWDRAARGQTACVVGLNASGVPFVSWMPGYSPST